MKPGEQRRLVVPTFALALERYWHHHVRGYQVSFAVHHFRQPLWGTMPLEQPVANPASRGENHAQQCVADCREPTAYTLPPSQGLSAR